MNRQQAMEILTQSVALTIYDEPFFADEDTDFEMHIIRFMDVRIGRVADGDRRRLPFTSGTQAMTAYRILLARLIHLEGQSEERRGKLARLALEADEGLALMRDHWKGEGRNR